MVAASQEFLTLRILANILAVLLCLCTTAAAQSLKLDSGYRQVTDAPSADDRSIVFWSFEQAPGSEAINPGKFEGGARIVDDGRFGKAVQLNGMRDAVVLGQLANLRGSERSFDFWMRFENSPTESQTLLLVGNRSERPVLQIELLAGGRLELRVEDIEPAVTEPLPAGSWLHIALADYFDPYPTMHPGVPSLRRAGVRLLVNGVERAVAAAPGGGPYHKGRRHGLPQAQQMHRLVLGNSLSLDRGFVGLIDEFRISNGPRHFYAPMDQPWLSPDQSRPITRDGRFFQDPAAEVLYEIFERRTGGGQKIPGIHGNAFLVEDPDGIRIELPKNLDLTGGTIEFWMRPDDWDNLFMARNENDANRYGQRRVNLVTLYGIPSVGKDDPQSLIRVQADRARIPTYTPGFDLTPNQWVHVAVVWGPGVEHYQPSVFIDGQNIPWDIRSRSASKARDEVWRAHRPSYLILGGDKRTAFDELRVHRIALREQEIRNAIAQARGEEMQALRPGAVRFDYRYSIGELDVVLDVMHSDVPQIAGAEVSCKLPHQNKTVTETIDSFDGGYGRTSGRATLRVGQLPEGDYPCTVHPLDNRRRKLASVDATFNRKHLPWLDTQVAKLDTPPPPFTPVERKDRTLQTIGRTQTIAANGLLESIDVLDKPILAGPIWAELRQGGQSHRFAATGTARFGEVNDMEANWQADASAAGVRLRTKAKMEYDGMTRFELTFDPARGMTVDGLSIVIPLHSEYGRYLHALPLGGDFRNYEISIQLPDRQGALWDSASGFEKRPIVRPTVGNFAPQVWLGDELRGLVWFADSDKGWVPNDARPAITIGREGGQVLLKLNLISAPFQLDTPRTVVFGLLPTPPKPLPKNYRVWNKGNNQLLGRIGGPLTSTDAFRPWIMAPREGAMHYWPWGYRWEHVEEAVKLERERRPNDALMLYGDKPWVARGKDAEYFGWEWHASGVRRTPAVYPPTQVDMLTWYWNEYMRRDIYDGIYLDDVFPTQNFNTETGSAYELPDGRIQPAVSFFGFREYVKRLRHVMHANGKLPMIAIHMTSTLIMPACSFVDLAWDGEDSVRFRDARNTFLDVWPMERFMNINIPQRTGMISQFMFKEAYSKAADKDPHRVHRLHRSVSAGQLLHDVSEEGRRLAGRGAGKEFVAVIDSYTTPDVTFHGYWQNRRMLSIQALMDGPLQRNDLPHSAGWRWKWTDHVLQEIASEPLRASVYRDDRLKRALIVVTNYARVPLRGKLVLDLSGFDVPHGSRDSVSIADVDYWPRSKKDTLRTPGRLLSRGNTVELTVDGHDFRLLELTWR